MRNPGTRFVADTAGPDFEVPKGSMAAGDRIKLPFGVEEPITVYVNGVEQRPDVDFSIEEGAERPEVVFPRPILIESNLGFSRWAALYLGLFGTYRPHESVDVHFTRDGQVEVIADAPVRFEEGSEPPGH